METARCPWRTRVSSRYAGSQAVVAVLPWRVFPTCDVSWCELRLSAIAAGCVHPQLELPEFTELELCKKALDICINFGFGGFHIA